MVITCLQIQLPALSSFFDTSFVSFFCQSLVLDIVTHEMTDTKIKEMKEMNELLVLLAG